MSLKRQRLEASISDLFAVDGLDVTQSGRRPFLASAGGLAPHAAEHMRIQDEVPGPWANSVSKRIFDVAFALIGLFLLSPVLLCAAIAVECTSDGDVLFRQQRVGRGETTFTIYKFRTMRSDAETSGPTVTAQHDPRTTRIGRTLRNLKLDELPQLYNVLRGDMSLVGPRPKIREHECMPMTVRPGITGAATLLFSREEEMLAQVPPHLVERYTVEVLNPVKARLDMRYARSGTFASDLQILFATVFRIGWNRQLADLADSVELTQEQSAA